MTLKPAERSIILNVSAEKYNRKAIKANISVANVVCWHQAEILYLNPPTTFPYMTPPWLNTEYM